ncbi:MAG: glycosyl transferase, WecB/TagA/CpsF family [Marmoricola sp.]|nr:glycosyl transferase, WecB/TagA/CpsF family [Marmoricola sp.]
MRRVFIDGIGFDVVTETQVAARVMDELDAGRGGCIVTPNVDIHRQLRRPEYADIAERADLVVADGMPIVWASRLQGDPLPERVSGASLVWGLSRAAASRGRTVFLLGAQPEVAALAAEVLAHRVPGLEVVGTCSPEPGFERSDEEFAGFTELLVRAAPDLVFCAFGFPKQERCMVRLMEQLPTAWFLGCGGSLDFIAGKTRRAPGFLQRAGLEWLHRLAQEPRRLGRRYLVHGLPHAARLLVRSSALGLAGRARARGDRAGGR